MWSHNNFGAAEADEANFLYLICPQYNTQYLSFTLQNSEGQDKLKAPTKNFKEGQKCSPRKSSFDQDNALAHS